MEDRLQNQRVRVYRAIATIQCEIEIIERLGKRLEQAGEIDWFLGDILIPSIDCQTEQCISNSHEYTKCLKGFELNGLYRIANKDSHVEVDDNGDRERRYHHIAFW